VPNVRVIGLGVLKPNRNPIQKYCEEVYQEVIMIKSLAVMAAAMILSDISATSQATSVEGALATDPTEPILLRDENQASGDLAEKIRALGSSNPNERAAAICSIGKLGPRALDAIPSLIQVLGDATETGHMTCDASGKWVRASGIIDESSIGKEAAKALASIGPPAVDQLAGALRNTNWGVRANSALALALINDERTIELLVGASTDGAWQVRELATWGMGLKSDKRVVGPLLLALRDREPVVRAQAAWALGMQGDESVVESLSSALKDESVTVQAQAAWALGMKGNEHTVEPLIAALKSDDKRVRSQAAWALGMHGDYRAVNALTVATKDENAEVRRQALWALEMVGMKGKPSR